MTGGSPTALVVLTATCTSKEVAARMVDRITALDASHSSVTFCGTKKRSIILS